MTGIGNLQELTEAELAFALEIILRSGSKAIPIMRGQGAAKDCTVRDDQMREFARHLAQRLHMHVRCYRGSAEKMHSVSSAT
jgi:hypothetical protein